MGKIKCKDCRWWDEDEPEPDEGKCKHGLCRRYPPVMIGDKYAYPYTDDFAWCGEFKPKNWPEVGKHDSCPGFEPKS